MRAFWLSVFCFLFLMGFSSVGHAQESVSSAETSGSVDETESLISEEKKKAIEELLEITEIGSRIKSLDRVFKRNARRTFRLTVIDELKSKQFGKTLSKEELEKIVKERTEKLSNRYDELFGKRVNLDGLVRRIAFDVYAKYFSVNEIKDIIGFYKTPTGSKARKVMPQLSRESMIETQKQLKPKLSKIVKLVLEETNNENLEEDSR